MYRQATPTSPISNEDVKISIAPDMSVCHESFTSGYKVGVFVVCQ